MDSKLLREHGGKCFPGDNPPVYRSTKGLVGDPHAHHPLVRLPRTQADALNRARWRSSAPTTGVLRSPLPACCRRKSHWLSEKSGTRWSDTRTDVPMHAHSIDAAQQGFYKACVTTRGLGKAGFTEARFPHWRRSFARPFGRGTGVRRLGDALILSTGRGRPKVEITIVIPVDLRDVLKFLEVQLGLRPERPAVTGGTWWSRVIRASTQASGGTNIVSSATLARSTRPSSVTRTPRQSSPAGRVGPRARDTPSDWRSFKPPSPATQKVLGGLQESL